MLFICLVPLVGFGAICTHTEYLVCNCVAVPKRGHTASLPYNATNKARLSVLACKHSKFLNTGSVIDLQHMRANILQPLICSLVQKLWICTRCDIAVNYRISDHQKNKKLQRRHQGLFAKTRGSCLAHSICSYGRLRKSSSIMWLLPHSLHAQLYGYQSFMDRSWAPVLTTRNGMVHKTNRLPFFLGGKAIHYICETHM